MEEPKKEEKIDQVLANVKLGFLVAYDIIEGILKGLARIPVIATNKVFAAIKKIFEALNGLTK